MDEQELPPSLKKAIERLDVKAHAAANRLDLEKVRAGTLERLARPTDVYHGMHRKGIAVASAAAVVGALFIGRMVFGNGPIGLPVAMDSVTAADSQAVLAAVGEVAVADTTVTTSAVLVDDLNEQELRALLQALENEEIL